MHNRLCREPSALMLNDSEHLVCSHGRRFSLSPSTCPNLRCVSSPCLSKLAYMSHVVLIRERADDGYLCSYRLRDLSVPSRAWLARL